MLFATLLIAAVNAQSNSNCIYRQNGLELDLLDFKNTELTYTAENYDWTYTICSNGLSCYSESESVDAMVEGHPSGINECQSWGAYNQTVQPFYDV